MFLKRLSCVLLGAFIGSITGIALILVGLVGQGPDGLVLLYLGFCLFLLGSSGGAITGALLLARRTLLPGDRRVAGVVALSLFLGVLCLQLLGVGLLVFR
jgi:hypothetical protein